MAINAEAKKLLVGGAWARSGDRVDPEDDTPALNRAPGYTQPFEQADGEVITREIALSASICLERIDVKI